MQHSSVFYMYIILLREKILQEALAKSTFIIILQETLSHTDNYYMAPIFVHYSERLVSWEINRARISGVTPISVMTVYQYLIQPPTAFFINIATLPSLPRPVSGLRTIYSQTTSLASGTLPHYTHCSSCVYHFQTVGPTTRRSFCSTFKQRIGN